MHAKLIAWHQSFAAVSLERRLRLETKSCALQLLASLSCFLSRCLPPLNFCLRLVRSVQLLDYAIVAREGHSASSSADSDT